MITTTLRQILDANPCYDPRDKGLLPADHNLDTPISFKKIVEKAGPEDAIWCFSILPDHKSLKRHFAVDCAERVKPLMTDERSLNALIVARRHALGQATDRKLAAAQDAAWNAAWNATRDEAGTATWDEAGAASWAAAWTTVGDAARAAAWAADAIRIATKNATYHNERAWQAARMVELTKAGEWTPPQP